MVAHRALRARALLRRARAPSCRRPQLAGLSTAAPKSWVPRDSEKLEKAAVSALLHEYSVKQQRTAEKMVPWFLRQMPAAYFRLVGDDERLAHLQATAGLFDEATGGLVDEDLEFRIVSPTDAEGRRHITYARVRDRPGTLERQVGALLGSDGGALENVKVFTSDCGSLCLNVFTLADSARPTHHATEAAAAAAAAPHVAFAEDRDGDFWAEAAVLAHAARCSPHYLATTRPDRWSFHRELHASVAGTESVAAGTYAAAADDGEPDAAWIAVAAPNALPANFLHKLLRLLGGLDLAVKRCHVDVVADGADECVLVRVLAAPGAAAAPTALDDAVAMVPRAKWLDDVALDLALDGREPLSAFALAKAEAVAALGSLAHRIVNELMMEKGELLASMAAAEKVKEEKDTLAGEKNEGKVADVQPPDDVEDFAQSVAKQIEENSILCVRCGRSLDHLEEITKQQATERDKRVRCLGYRVLLNPLPPGQRPPDRSHAWAQACMRSVVVAKARHDRLHAEESLCSRFPEFVHAWFAKQPVIELTQKERNRLLVMAQQGVKEDEPTVSDEDGNRWAFYAKVKQLAALGSTEANLFWLLLDETHGDDYLAFFLHCLTAIVSVAGATLHDQLGLCGRGLSYRQLALLAAKDDPNLRKTDGSYDAAVLVKHLDSCVRGTGVVFVYLAQAYATLDALLVGPLKLRGEVVKKAVRGLAHPATESKLGDFDDGKGLPRDDANVWLLYGTVPRDTVVPKPKEPKKRAGDDGDAPKPKAETPRTYCLRAAKEANKDAHDGLTLAIDMFSFLQVLMHIFKDEQSTRNAAVRVMFGAAAGPRGDFGNLTSDSISAIDKATAELKKSNGDLAFAKLPKDLTLDLPKFASVARALWPRRAAARHLRRDFDGTIVTHALRPCVEKSPRAIGSSKNEPNRRRCDRAREA